MQTLFLDLLLLQAAMGALDTVLHHELLVKLPDRRGAGPELRLHAIRALLYGATFALFACGWPQGAWIALVWVVVAVELLLTLKDFVIEDRTRLLPASERVLHTLLAVNAGALLCAFALASAPGWALPTMLAEGDRGWRAALLAAVALAVTISGLRDALAARAQLARAPVRPVGAGLPMRHVLVAGGTGFLGGAVAEGLLAAGHRVTVLSRDPRAAALRFQGRARAIASPDELRADERVDAIVHLAGAPVVGPPWTRARRAELLASRVGISEALDRYLARATHRPGVWIQGSAVGIYGYRGPASPETEGLPELPGDFASALCARWEAVAPAVPARVDRRVFLRLGIVLDRHGGLLPPLALANAFGLGAVLGSGAQPFPWIHLEDVLAFVERALVDATLAGPYNLVGPERITQRELADTMAAVARRPRLLRVPGVLLAAPLGEMANLLLQGPVVDCLRMQQAGHAFRHATLRSALDDCLGRPPIPAART